MAVNPTTIATMVPKLPIWTVTPGHFFHESLLEYSIARGDGQVKMNEELESSRLSVGG